MRSDVKSKMRRLSQVSGPAGSSPLLVVVWAGIDMVDEEHVVAVCAVRATGSNDSLTRMVQKLLGRLPRKLVNVSVEGIFPVGPVSEFLCLSFLTNYITLHTNSGRSAQKPMRNFPEISSKCSYCHPHYVLISPTRLLL